MVIFSIPNTEKFLNLVEKSHGDVTLHLPDGGQADLKRSHVARELFRMINPGQSGLQIGLTDSADTQTFIRYMMENAANH